MAKDPSSLAAISKGNVEKANRLAQRTTKIWRNDWARGSSKAINKAGAMSAPPTSKTGSPAKEMYRDKAKDNPANVSKVRTIKSNLPESVRKNSRAATASNKVSVRTGSRNRLQANLV